MNTEMPRLNVPMIVWTPWRIFTLTLASLILVVVMGGRDLDPPRLAFAAGIFAVLGVILYFGIKWLDPRYPIDVRDGGTFLQLTFADQSTRQVPFSNIDDIQLSRDRYFRIWVTLIDPGTMRPKFVFYPPAEHAWEIIRSLRSRLAPEAG